jgi:BirA family biotin operon repressor/biotin-[acetyl-CoA-carboxylase] ligase
MAAFAPPARWQGSWLRHHRVSLTDKAQGQPCFARLPDETITGVAEGLDGDGALRLRTAAGVVRRITAGDVFF